MRSVSLDPRLIHLVPFAMGKRWGFSILSCLSVVTIAFGQGTTSRVVGTLQDPTGSVVPNAAIKLINEATRVTFETTTSAAGTYAFEAVQPGSYELNVEANGFRKLVSRGNLVTIGQPATINVRLEVGAVTEQIMVEASAETVQTSSSGNYGNLVSRQAVTDLPIV